MDEISGPDLDPLASHLDLQLPFHEIKTFIFPQMGVHGRSTSRRHQALHDKTGTTAGFSRNQEAVTVTTGTPERFS
jgi:hypothetical protein